MEDHRPQRHGGQLAHQRFKGFYAVQHDRQPVFSGQFQLDPEHAELTRHFGPPQPVEARFAEGLHLSEPRFEGADVVLCGIPRVNPCRAQLDGVPGRMVRVDIDIGKHGWTKV